MLRITTPEQELFDEKTNRFITIKSSTLTLEHSLISISKWESKFCKPFISKDKKTAEELFAYIKCMSVDPKTDPKVFDYITSDGLKEIFEYINAPMTATTVRDMPGHGDREVLTSEVIYYLMVAYQIPFECEKWHLNRLLTLIKVCQAKNEKPRKMSRSEIMAQNAKLNAERRKALKR